MSTETKRVRLPGSSRALLAIVVIPLLSGITVATRAWLAPVAHAVPGLAKTTKLTAAVDQRNRIRSQLEGELVTITPTGFEPAEIRPEHGHFILMVDNRSGLEDVVVRLDRKAGSRLREVRERPEQLDWSDEMNLEPGRYVLTEANHPDWVCNIIVAVQ